MARHTILHVIGALAILGICAVPGTAQQSVHTKPDPVMSKVVEGMPRGEKQEIHVMRATFTPGQRTVFHTHRFPVTIYILEGAFTLELEGRPPVTIKAGEAFVEPPNVKMTGYNRSTTENMRLVIFYVGDPGTPFLDLVH
jgi:quercetin dioxygenase-like cupin family protein